MNGMLNRFFQVICCCLCCLSLTAQNNFKPTNTINIVGDIKESMTIKEADLLKCPLHDIGDLTIYNHLGEQKSIQKKLKGVLVKDVLGKLELNTPGPRQLSEFYFTVLASDGYKVVFSWNELFNSPTGDHIFFIVERDGININQLDERLLLVTTTDFKTGRRHVKNVSQIQVSRVK